MTQTKKGRSRDRKFVSMQPHEIAYVVGKHKVPKADVISATKKVKSRHRPKVYAVLREMGHKIVTKAFPEG